MSQQDQTVYGFGGGVEDEAPLPLAPGSVVRDVDGILGEGHLTRRRGSSVVGDLVALDRGGTASGSEVEVADAQPMASFPDVATLVARYKHPTLGQGQIPRC